MGAGLCCWRRGEREKSGRSELVKEACLVLLSLAIRQVKTRRPEAPRPALKLGSGEAFWGLAVRRSKHGDLAASKQGTVPL